MKITVTDEFIAHRTAKAGIYNGRGRSEEQFLMDLDCEIYEWHMINSNIWLDSNDWKIDAVVPDPDGYKAVDVKFISKWYNISCTKMHNILQQRRILDGYLFCEWTSRPNRPLQAGDEVEFKEIGYIEYEDLVDEIKVSRGKWGGFYADVRKALMV